MLAYYAGHFRAVEINNTFYRMPTRRGAGALGRRDAARVPLRAQEPAADHARQAAGRRGVGGRAAGRGGAARWATSSGPILFQLPPNMKKDLARLDDFLAALPAGLRAPRSSSATSPGSPTTSTAACARDGAALCIAESEDLATPLEATADWGYLRLRRAGLRRRRGRRLGRAHQGAGLVDRPTSSSSTRTTGKGPIAGRPASRA